MSDTESAAARSYAEICLRSFGTGHDMDHTLRVAANADRLCSKIPGSDRLTVITAAEYIEIPPYFSSRMFSGEMETVSVAPICGIC